MNDANQKTIESYDTHIQDYIDGTPQEVSGFVKQWLDTSFEAVSKDAVIFEIGSAFGRDAKYLEDKGFKVIRTDVTPSFVDLLKNQGYEASIFNAITDDFPGNLDVVLANAVLLHFTGEEAMEVMKKIYKALRPNGTFIFSVKRGEGEEWTDKKLGAPRFFHYWQPNELESALTAEGFREVRINTAASEIINAEDTTWLHGVAQK